MKKIEHNKMFSITVLLIGLVMLVEAAATMLVLVAAPSIAVQASVAWGYVLLKSVVGLFAIIAGFGSMRK